MRLRGDLEIEMRLSSVTREGLQPVLRSFSEEFRAERATIGFGGDGAGNWHGSARIRHRGDVIGARSRLDAWPRGTLPSGASYTIRRMARGAAG